MDSFTKYRFVLSSNRNPNASSNLAHAASGNQISGTEESINDTILESRRDVSFCVFSVLMALIDWIPTSKLLDASGLKGNFMELGSKRDESYPPSVKLPRAFFSLYGAPAVYPNERLGILRFFFKLCRKPPSGLLKSEVLEGFDPSPSWPK